MSALNCNDWIFSHQQRLLIFALNTIMGNQESGLQDQISKQQTRIKQTQLSESECEVDQVWEEQIQKQQYLCCVCESTVQKKIVWEDDFIRNCNEIKQQFQWAEHFIQMVRNNPMNKYKYYQQINNLKKENKKAAPNHKEFISTPAELQSFKKNLKKSMIVSFAPNHQEPNKIQTNINTKIKASRIEIQRFSKNANNNNAVRTSIALIDKSNSWSSKQDTQRSIASVHDSPLPQDKEILKQTAKDLEVFIKFSNILEKHLGDENCMLGRIMRLFIVFIEMNFKDPATASEHIDSFVDNIKQYLVILKEAVIGYYNLNSFAKRQPAKDHYSNPFIANQQNILSACTSILFKDHIFYNILFNALRHYFLQRETNFHKILQHLRGSSPERFTVKDKFCLNSRTLKNYLSNMSVESGSHAVQNIQINDVIVEHSQPYRNCINNLAELVKCRSPINKMKAIMACSEGITQQIQRFYDLNGLRKQKWLLDADQVLSIFCYIIVATRIQHLHCHLFILDTFATSHQTMAMAGYYIAVINSAVEHLQNDYTVDTHDTAVI